jgi:hypothetical protein
MGIADIILYSFAAYYYGKNPFVNKSYCNKDEMFNILLNNCTENTFDVELNLFHKMNCRHEPYRYIPKTGQIVLTSFKNDTDCMYKIADSYGVTNLSVVYVLQTDTFDIYIPSSGTYIELSKCQQ